MLQHLVLDDFLALAKTATRVAIFREISADRLTPIGIIESLKTEMLDGAVLESGLCHQDEGRYSYITFGKLAVFQVQNNIITQRIGHITTTHVGDPFVLLRQLLVSLACSTHAEARNFINGAIGFIAYDAIRLFEAIPDSHPSDTPFPEMLFHFYQNTLIFDHLKQKLHISITVNVAENPLQTYRDTEDQIATIISKITTRKPHSSASYSLSKQHTTSVEVDVADDAFISLVERAKQHIIEGDAFQIVLSRCFKTAYSASPFDIYRALRTISPAPYMFYLPTDFGILVGASPEKLISVRERQVEIHPIAGTRARLETSDDNVITETLLNDPKEVAEHMMLVDLARNDIGAVCEPGSVVVSELLQVKHFSHVSHITSVVTGLLRENLDAFDALAATFPAGTLSGAPKIRAMQLIDDLETSKRGMYGGAICRLDNLGNFDSCIAIRMAVLKDGIATVRTGAGIVYDSCPQAEANETRQKAEGVLQAIQYAEEGLA